MVSKVKFEIQSIQILNITVCQILFQGPFSPTGVKKVPQYSPYNWSHYRQLAFYDSDQWSVDKLRTLATSYNRLLLNTNIRYSDWHPVQKVKSQVK